MWPQTVCSQSSGNKAGALTNLRAPNVPEEQNLEVYYCMKIATTTRDSVKFYHSNTKGNI